MQVPARLQRRLPRRARTGRPEPLGAAGGHQPACASSRPTPASPSRGAASARRTGRCTTRTCTASACRRGTSVWSSSAACSPPPWSIGVGGLARAPRRPVGRHGRRRRAAARQPVRAGAAALAALQHGAVGQRASLHKLFTILDTEPDVDEHADAVALPPRGDLVVDGVTFALSRHVDRRRSSTCRSTSAPASGWRSSARPAPASRRSPS